ncbi:MAG: hypothetical protein AB7P21_07160 [Lautropia sp.]
MCDGDKPAWFTIVSGALVIYNPARVRWLESIPDFSTSFGVLVGEPPDQRIAYTAPGPVGTEGSFGDYTIGFDSAGAIEFYYVQNPRFGYGCVPPK